MKMKKLIAKSLVLALALTMLIPTPTYAASKGGKLVKSVTGYSYNTSKNRWEKEYLSKYTYDKKGYPKEINNTNYYDHIMGIPMGASISLNTFKYKYKGKAPKSLTIKNTAGKVVETRKYTKGRVSSSTSPRSYDWYEEENGTFIISQGAYTVKYNKKGFATSKAGSSASSYKYTDYSGSRSDTYSTTYSVTQKKGVPQLIVASTTETWNYSDSDGDKGSGSTTTPDVYYTKFNKNGYAIESGYVEQGTNAYKPNYKIQYKTKKGVVTAATVYRVKSDGTMTPTYMYKFKYEKTKISQERYFNMVNSLVGYNNAQFSWF